MKDVLSSPCGDKLQCKIIEFKEETLSSPCGDKLQSTIINTISTINSVIVPLWG